MKKIKTKCFRECSWDYLKVLQTIFGSSGVKIANYRTFLEDDGKCGFWGLVQSASEPQVS